MDWIWLDFNNWALSESRTVFAASCNRHIGIIQLKNMIESHLHDRLAELVNKSHVPLLVFMEGPRNQLFHKREDLKAVRNNHNASIVRQYRNFIADKYEFCAPPELEEAESAEYDCCTDGSSSTEENRPVVVHHSDAYKLLTRAVDHYKDSDAVDHNDLFRRLNKPVILDIGRSVVYSREFRNKLFVVTDATHVEDMFLEADHMISIACGVIKRMDNHERPNVLIATNDKDFLQLVDEQQGIDVLMHNGKLRTLESEQCDSGLAYLRKLACFGKARQNLGVVWHKIQGRCAGDLQVDMDDFELTLEEWIRMNHAWNDERELVTKLMKVGGQPLVDVYVSQMLTAALIQDSQRGLGAIPPELLESCRETVEYAIWSVLNGTMEQQHPDNEDNDGWSVVVVRKKKSPKTKTKTKTNGNISVFSFDDESESEEIIF